MKTFFKFFTLFLFMLLLATITSCRTESEDIFEVNENEILKEDSDLAKLLLKVAMNDGSKDNILDNTSCSSVALPVDILLNGIETTIASEEDYELIALSFSEFDDDNDIIEFIFPITIITSDFTVISIENLNQLEEIIENCETTIDSDDEEDDDLECIDLKYPIAGSVFDANNELIEILTLKNDSELFKFIKSLYKYDIANLVFPITVQPLNDQEVNIETSENLLNILNNVAEECDENDLDIKNFESILVDNEWNVQKFKDNESTETSDFDDYVFNFKENGTITVLTTNVEIIGTWFVLTRIDGGLDITIDFQEQSPLNKLNKEWNVKKIKDKRLMLDDRNDTEISKDELFFEQLR